MVTAVVFTRSFAPGVAKSRLRAPATALPDSFIDQLHYAMTADLLSQIERTTAITQVICAWSPAIDEEAFNKMFHGTAPVTHTVQRGASFGERIDHLLQREVTAAQSPFLLLGSDCPLISSAILEQAALAVVAGELALGPAPEGGFYLLGVPVIENIPALESCFASGDESHAVREKFSALKLTLLPALSDIDLEQDLISLLSWIPLAEEHNRNRQQKLYLPQQTAQLLRKLSVQSSSSATRTKRLCLR